MSVPHHPLAKHAKRFGLAGLLPQVFLVLLSFYGRSLHDDAHLVGFAYAVLIFSFLGGMWWGLAVRDSDAPLWIYAVGVMPSLIALGLCFPWGVGGHWPQPNMLLLGVLIGASPLVDTAIDRQLALPIGWLRLRWQLALGLGVLTAILALS